MSAELVTWSRRAHTVGFIGTGTGSGPVGDGRRRGHAARRLELSDFDPTLRAAIAVSAASCVVSAIASTLDGDVWGAGQHVATCGVALCVWSMVPPVSVRLVPRRVRQVAIAVAAGIALLAVLTAVLLPSVGQGIRSSAALIDAFALLLTGWAELTDGGGGGPRPSRGARRGAVVGLD